MDSYVDVAALSKVLVVSLLFGAGIPALFAVGVRALAPAADGADGTPGARPGPARRAVGVLCFAVVVAAVVLGVVRLVTGSK
jgi:hypothetical protein